MDMDMDMGMGMGMGMEAYGGFDSGRTGLDAAKCHRSARNQVHNLA